MRAARTVLAAKNAILHALDDLAAWIDEAQRRLSRVPVVGGVLAAPLELVEPLVDAARQRIVVMLDIRHPPARSTTSSPRSSALVELDKSLVQELRKLVKGEASADWPTTPSAVGAAGQQPRAARPRRACPPGPLRRPGVRCAWRTRPRRPWPEAGFDVEQLARPPCRPVPGRKRAGLPDRRQDLRLRTRRPPRSVRNICDPRRCRTRSCQGQADRIIININAADVRGRASTDLRRQFQEHPIPGSEGGQGHRSRRRDRRHLPVAHHPRARLSRDYHLHPRFGRSHDRPRGRATSSCPRRRRRRAGRDTPAARFARPGACSAQRPARRRSATREQLPYPHTGGRRCSASPRRSACCSAPSRGADPVE